MRILRGLKSQILPCGCFVGIYESYEGDVLPVLDCPGERCLDDTRVPGTRLEIPLEASESLHGLGTSDESRTFPLRKE